MTITDTIPQQVAAMQMAYDVCALGQSLAKAHTDRTGIYADSARLELAKIKAAVAGIEAALSKLPTDERRAA